MEDHHHHHRMKIYDEFPLARPLDWAKGFFVLNSDTAIAHTVAFKQGQILPMDPSSSLAVENLSLTLGDNVLDLCTAPGTKLVLISQKVCSKNGKCGSVTGVDLSKERISSAIKLAKRFKLLRVRLFCTDGRSFNIPIQEILPPHDSSNGLKFQSLYGDNQGEKPIYCSAPYRKYPGRFSNVLYDKVLVDAQCTHDGSIKHVQKHIQSNWSNFNPEHYSSDGLKELYGLQLSLLENGFNLLKAGGLLVYSTCSLTKEQNEIIITKFMNLHNHEATVESPIGPSECIFKFGEDLLALRIHPSATTGGGFFVCRIRRKSQSFK